MQDSAFHNTCDETIGGAAASSFAASAPTHGSISETEFACAIAPQDRSALAYFSPKEFAAKTGLGLSTVYRYLSQGKLQKLQLGGKGARVLIPVQAIDFSKGGGSKTESISPEGQTNRDAIEKLGHLPGRKPLWMSDLKRLL